MESIKPFPILNTKKFQKLVHFGAPENWAIVNYQSVFIELTWQQKLKPTCFQTSEEILDTRKTNKKIWKNTILSLITK